MKKCFFILFQLLCFVLITNAQNVEGNLPFEISLEVIASGFSSPTDIANAGDSRLFIVERNGKIRILNEDGSINQADFLDIDDRVRNTAGQSEQGLLALEFHPDYSNNGYFFVHYSDNSGNTVISRFETDSNDPNLGLANTEEIIYTAVQPFTNHNGGSIKFGPDWMLYIGLGDGGSANDPRNLAQDVTSPLGKMLRIDINNGLPFTIPVDNPFVNDASVLDEIWAIGLRNPWKWSFDRMTNDIWMADVGQGQWEEINLQPATSTGGENYGWRCREGAHDFNQAGCQGGFTEPVAEYNHLGFTHCSVTGGYVYRGEAQIFNDAPPIYLYADYCSGTFWGAYQEPLAGGEYRSYQMNRIFGQAISTFGEDANGELYVAALNSGRVFRLNAECNIDVILRPETASCEEASNGSIFIFGNDGEFYDMEVVSLDNPGVLLDPNALPPGLYEVSVSRFGCVMIDSIAVGIALEPIDVSTQINEDNATLTVNTEAVSYQWFLDGALIGETQSITVTEGGVYTVIIVQENGCETTDEFVVELTNVQGIESINKWELVPNPVNDKLTMTLEVSQNENFTLSVMDAAGKQLDSRQIEVTGSNSYSIDMSNYAEGIYLIVLSNGIAQQSRKVVKQ